MAVRTRAQAQLKIAEGYCNEVDKVADSMESVDDEDEVRLILTKIGAGPWAKKGFCGPSFVKTLNTVANQTKTEIELEDLRTQLHLAVEAAAAEADEDKRGRSQNETANFSRGEPPNENSKWCDLHKWGGHETKNCNRIIPRAETRSSDDDKIHSMSDDDRSAQAPVGVCKFHWQGQTCKFGDNCKFKHVTPKEKKDRANAAQESSTDDDGSSTAYSSDDTEGTWHRFPVKAMVDNNEVVVYVRMR